MMDMFSLEEDNEFNQLFITQMPRVEKVTDVDYNEKIRDKGASLSLLENGTS